MKSSNSNWSQELKEAVAAAILTLMDSEESWSLHFTENFVKNFNFCWNFWSFSEILIFFLNLSKVYVTRNTLLLKMKKFSKSVDPYRLNLKKSLQKGFKAPVPYSNPTPPSHTLNAFIITIKIPFHKTKLSIKIIFSLKMSQNSTFS